MTDYRSLDAVNLECRREDRLLFSRLNFSVKSGEILEICGRNGSGKTTLLRLLCGLRQADDGHIEWCGHNIRHDSEAYRSALSYVGHQSGLKADLSPFANLCADAQLFAAETARVLPALQRMGLGSEIHSPCQRLSAGQRQRTALARLLVRESLLWILDEPCASLDKEAQGDVQSLFEEHANRGGIVIFTTHQPLTITGAKVEQLWLGDMVRHA